MFLLFRHPQFCVVLFQLNGLENKGQNKVVVCDSKLSAVLVRLLNMRKQNCVKYQNVA